MDSPAYQRKSSPFLSSFERSEARVPPLPLLYAIQASVLRLQLEYARQDQELPSIRMARGSKDINHAQFADDTLLLGGASQIIARRFKSEINRYCLASGSKINLRKSHIYGWNITPGDMLDISRVLNMDGVVSWESFSYLGVPIFKTKSKSSAWTPIVDKIKRKIIGWGIAWLNLAGKVILIKAVLNSFLIYQCSLLLASVKIITQIEGLIKSFLWQRRDSGGKRIALVNWNTFKLPRYEGGLHIRDLRT